MKNAKMLNRFCILLVYILNLKNLESLRVRKDIQRGPQELL